MKVVLITGSSSGIGLAAAERFRAAGYEVVGLSRREGVDVTDDAAVEAALKRALDLYGRIDVLVNNAGIGFFGPTELESAEDLRRAFEVNFFAAVRLTQKVLSVFRRQGGGRIVNVASAAAMFPLPYQSGYTATKSALLAWSRALSGEVARFGIQVSVVCPGDVKTSFTSSRRAFATEDPVYGKVAARALEKAARAEQGGGTAQKIADEIFLCATKRRPPLVAIPGVGYAWLDRAARLLPRTLVSRLIAKIYA